MLWHPQKGPTQSIKFYGKKFSLTNGDNYKIVFLLFFMKFHHFLTKKLKKKLIFFSSSANPTIFSIFLFNSQFFISKNDYQNKNYFYLKKLLEKVH